MYTGNPGYIWDERLSKCQHRHRLRTRSHGFPCQVFGEPSCWWRRKIVWTKGSRWAKTGRRGSTTWSPEGLDDFFLDQEHAPTSCVHDKQRHIFLKQHKNEMQEGVFLFFNATIDINRFFFGSIWRGCLNLPAFQRRCWATGLHRSWIMPWPRLSRSFARENARWSRKFQSPLGTKIYFGFGISQQNSDGLISLQGDVGPDWFLLGKRWSTSNHLLPFPKKKLNLMEWYETFGA